jgi:hypothetical protein
VTYGLIAPGINALSVVYRLLVRKLLRERLGF